MRFVIFSIFAVLWVAMWWWTYTCHVKLVCCPGYADKTAAAVTIDPDDDRPLLFRWSEAEPIVTSAFGGLRDSLVAMVGEHESLQITGFAFRDEQDGGTDLGTARAQAIGALIAAGGDSIDVVTRGEIANLSGDVRNQAFEAATFEVVYTGPEVPDIATHITFRFGQNTTSVMRDTALDTYIQKLAERLELTDEKVQLTGHSDNIGPSDENYQLGLQRARSVGALLQAAGIPPQHIVIDSKGEDAPVVSNGTADGRRQNRRVELEIIQPQ